MSSDGRGLDRRRARTAQELSEARGQARTRDNRAQRVVNVDRRNRHREVLPCRVEHWAGTLSHRQAMALPALAAVMRPDQRESLPPQPDARVIAYRPQLLEIAGHELACWQMVGIGRGIVPNAPDDRLVARRPVPRAFADDTSPVAPERECSQRTGAPHTGCARGNGAGCCPTWVRLPPRTARRDGVRETRSRGTGPCVRRRRSVPHRAATRHVLLPPVCGVPMQYSRPGSIAVTRHGQTCAARGRRSAAPMHDRGSRRRLHPAAYVGQAPARAEASRASHATASPGACTVPAQVASRRQPAPGVQALPSCFARLSEATWRRSLPTMSWTSAQRESDWRHLLVVAVPPAG